VKGQDALIIAIAELIAELIEEKNKQIEEKNKQIDKYKKDFVEESNKRQKSEDLLVSNIKF